jgi:hypothetical protein
MVSPEARMCARAGDGTTVVSRRFAWIGICAASLTLVTGIAHTAPRRSDTTPRSFVEPARYAPVITAPRSTLAATHRIRRQHPSVPYNVRITVVHGAYPFRYALTANVPKGMVVDSATGVISWPSPSAGKYNDITFTVTDAAGTVVSDNWDLTVGTSGHAFIDAVAGNDRTGAGTFARPWASLAKAYESAGAGSIVWIKGPGRYRLLGLPIDNCTRNPLECRVRWNVKSQPVAFIGYGSSKPLIDFEHNGTYCTNFPTCKAVRRTPRMQLVGAGVWVDNIRAANPFIMAFQVGDHSGTNGWTVRRVDFSNCGPGFNGSNAACVMSESTGGTPRFGSYFGENTSDENLWDGSNTDSGTDVYKLYSEEYMQISDNALFNSTAFAADGLISIKGGTHRHIDVRANSIQSPGGGIGGNNAGADHVEIRFNFVSVSGTHPRTSEPPNVVFTNQGPMSARNIHYYRNTFVNGRVRIRDDVLPALGPYRFTRNVIINEDGAQAIPYFCDGRASSGGWADCSGLTAGVIVDTENLKGNAAAGIVDAGGILQGTYLKSYGPATATPRGHRLP